MYALEHGGVLYRLDSAAAPELELERAGSSWRWRLNVRARLPDGGALPLTWQGRAASEAAARAAALGCARELFGRRFSWPPAGGKPPPAAKAPQPVWRETLPARRLPRLVKAERVKREGRDGENVVTVKRDCVTGRFAPSRARANDCRLPEKPSPWWRGQSRQPEAERVCYPTRNAALMLFRFANRDLIDRAGGLDQKMTGGEFDVVNLRFSRRGPRRVRTLAEAIEAVMPSGRPFCLARMDLETLNETGPGQAVGGFRLPDVVAEASLWEKMKREQRDHALDDDAVPF